MKNGHHLPMGSLSAEALEATHTSMKTVIQWTQQTGRLQMSLNNGVQSTIQSNTIILEKHVRMEHRLENLENMMRRLLAEKEALRLLADSRYCALELTKRLLLKPLLRVMLVPMRYCHDDVIVVPRLYLPTAHVRHNLTSTC